MKKEKRMTIYCILFILLLVSLFIAFKYYELIHDKNKIIKKEISNVEMPIIKESSNIEEDIDINSQLAIELKNKINVFDTYKAGSYYGYFYKNDYLDINNISDDAKIVIGITQNSNFSSDFVNATYAAQAPDGTNLDVVILSKNDIQNGINDFFGPNTSYNDTDLIDSNNSYCGFSGFKFDDTRNVYMSNPLTCSIFPAPHIDSKVINVHRINNKVELTLKIAYIKYSTNSSGEVIKYVYKSDSDSDYIEKHDVLTDNSYNIYKIFDKLDSFKFTFTLNSNNYYYFTKVEKM